MKEIHGKHAVWTQTKVATSGLERCHTERTQDETGGGAVARQRLRGLAVR